MVVIIIIIFLNAYFLWCLSYSVITFAFLYQVFQSCFCANPCMYCHQWGYLFRGDSTWDLDPLSDKHNTLSRKCPYQCQYNVKLELFWCTKALCRAQEFKEKHMRQRDFVLLLNSCFRMRDLKEEWGKMPLNLYGAAGERKELFWKQYEHGRVLSLQMPWPFSRMRFALSLLKARAHHCWVNQRST